MVFDADDPVFGGGACQIEGCRRPARGRGMCPGHLQRWVKRRPPGSGGVRRGDGSRGGSGSARTRSAGCPAAVTVRAAPGCVSCTASSGNARDDPTWTGGCLTRRRSNNRPAGATCRIDHCRLWPQASLPFCHAHAQTWKANGRPDIDQFATGFESTRGHRGRDDPVGPARPATRVGDPVRDAVPPRRAHEQDASRRS